MGQLAATGVSLKMLRLLLATLQDSSIIIEAGVTELAPFTQTTGVIQGDNLSPLFSFVLVCDLPTAVLGKNPRCQVLMYANDVVIYEPSRFHVWQALVRINAYSNIHLRNSLSTP